MTLKKISRIHNTLISIAPVTRVHSPAIFNAFQLYLIIEPMRVESISLANRTESSHFPTAFSLITSPPIPYPFLFSFYLLFSILDIISRALPTFVLSLHKPLFKFNPTHLYIVRNQQAFFADERGSLLARLKLFVVVALLGAESSAFAAAGVADYDFCTHFGVDQW